MSISNIPPLQFDLTGVSIPAPADVLAGAQADINAAFGGTLNPALETPQGQIATSFSAAINNKNAEIATVVNQMDPQYADGRFQDALGRIYFLTRKPATHTAVGVTVTGLTGTIIPIGTLAKDAAGQMYESVGAITIGPAGSTNGVFQAVDSGPINCPAGSLTQVYQAVAGWDSITNAGAGTPGSDVEGRADFEFRRRNSVSINATGTPAAIYSAVFDVANVVDCYVIDNASGATVLAGATNYPLLPHSVYIAVVGGLDADVAAAVWTKKSLGCDYNGNTTVTVNDPSGYSTPPPTYAVTFMRPTALTVKFAVSIVTDPTLPANAVALTKAAILARFSGADGTKRERIGSGVLASRYYSAVAAAIPGAEIEDILIGISSATLTRVSVGIDQTPTLSAADISVTLT